MDRIGRCLNVRTTLLKEILSQANAQNGIHSTEQSCSTGQAAEAEMEASTAALLSTLNSMQTNVAYVGSELSIGSLDRGDLEKVHELLTEVLKPVVGLMSCMDHASKMLIDMENEKHRQALTRVDSQSTRANRLLLGSLQFGLESLRLNRRKIGASHAEYSASLGVIDLATLRRELGELDISFNAKEEDANHGPSSSDTRLQDDIDQTLLLLTFQVSGLCRYYCSLLTRVNRPKDYRYSLVQQR